MANKILEYFNIKKQEKEEFLNLLDDLSSQISQAYSEYADIFSDSAGYIDVRTTNAWKQRFSKTYDSASSYLKDGMIEKKKPPRKYEETLAKMGAMYSHIDEQRINHNKKATAGDSVSAAAAFTEISGGKNPSGEQLEAITARDRYALITGAPSTGKSTALRAKIKYMSDKYQLPPESIFFIDAADINNVAHMAANILCECGEDIASSEICINDDESSLSRKAKQFLNEKITDSPYRSRLIDYYLKFHSAGHTAFEFDTPAGYEKYMELFPAVSLNGEKLKSYEELDIANFLFALGVEYEYHAPFNAAAALKGARTRYMPDFTLKNYNICINVYTLDENDQTVSGDSALNGTEHASKKYLEVINDIRSIHEEAEIPLIECYSRNKHSGNMLSRLQSDLSALGVSFNIKTDGELFDAIMKTEPEFLDTVAETISKGACVMLASDMGEDILLDLSRTKSKTVSALYKRHERIMSLIMPFYNYYLSEIPWSHDPYRIILRAAGMLHDRRPAVKYKHIFIDNMENICACSMKLAAELAGCGSCSVTAAGCLWTSCTGFRGADSVYLSEFGRFFPGFSEVECRHVYDMPRGIFEDMRSLAVSSGAYMGYKPLLSKNSEYSASMLQGKNAAGSSEMVCMSYADSQKLSAFIETVPAESSVLAVCRYESELEYFSGILSEYSNVKCACALDADGKYDVVIWVNTKFSSFGFPDERLCLNDISALVLRRPQSAIYDAERFLLCKAMSHTKGRFVLLCDERDISDCISELINKV